MFSLFSSWESWEKDRKGDTASGYLLQLKRRKTEKVWRPHLKIVNCRSGHPEESVRDKNIKQCPSLKLRDIGLRFFRGSQGNPGELVENSSVALPQDSWHEGLFNRQCHCNFSFALEMLWILAVFINVRLDDQNKSICMNFDQFGFFPYNICQNDSSITIFVYEWKNIAVHIGVQL